MKFIHYQTKDDSTYKKEYILDGVSNSTLNIPYGNKSEDQVLDIFTPVKGKKPYPTIVYIHGGGLKQGDKSRHINSLLQGLRYGYALVCVNYRLANEAPFPSMIYDVTSAIRFLKAHAVEYGLDSEKFIVWGETHGAYLACLVGIYGHTGEYNDPECEYNTDASVAGVIDYWAMTDLEKIYKARLEAGVAPDEVKLEEVIFGKKGDELIETINQYPKPLDGINKDTPPFYVLHSEFDPVIPRSHSVDYYNTLDQAGVDVTFELVRDTKHALPNYKEAWQIENTYRFIHRIFGRNGKEL